jgi:hypothetical protein
MSEAGLSGGCLCKTVRYRVSGEPRLVSHCHCSLCRRATGAPFVTWVTIRAEQLSLERGTLTRHASSDHGWRAFCAICGTHVSSGSSRYPNYVEVTVASLDRPGEVMPQRHVYWPDRVAWVRVADDLPRHVGDARSPLVDHSERES